MLENVLCVPDIAKNLVTVSKLAKDSDVYIEFHTDYCLVKKMRLSKMVLIGELRDGLYRLNIVSAITSSASSSNNLESAKNKVVYSALVQPNLPISVNAVVSKEVWHCRLGHPSSKIFHSIVRDCNLPVRVNDSLHFCEACKYGKSHALPFPISSSRANALFVLVHTDVWGPAPIMLADGFKYYVPFLYAIIADLYGYTL